MSANGGVDVVVEGISRSFDSGRIVALHEVSLQVAAGEFVALTGPSGCGKSTLLNLIGGLDRPDRGTITVGGRRVENLVNASEYRAGTVGFVFQFHNLISTLDARENVQIPMLGRGPSRADRERRATRLLSEVGLEQRLRSYPTTLSGGERQRVAIARALANRPRLLLADEPTGSLDSATGAQIVELVQRVREERRMTVLLVTNDDGVAAAADRILHMRDGRLNAGPE
jgi:putative ABC transport system ATP-binding protein